MIEAVTDVIVARARPMDGLQKMVAWSIGAHVALVGVALLLSRETTPEPPREVMTISLGGTPGPRTGGMTQAGDRAVQAPAPPEPVKRAETPPAPKAPPMTLPDPKAKTRVRARPDQAPDDATGRTSTTGPQPREGSTAAETRVRGQGFGLSSGGGLGASVQLDVSNFCCPEYLAEMVDLVTRNWDKNQGVVGSTVVKFTIRRDGTLEMVAVERPSGFFALDNAATRALLLTRRIPALPPQFADPSLTVHVTFVYSR